MIIKDSGKGDFENPEPGSYSAVCVRVVDLGQQESEYLGEKKVAHKVWIAWEIEEKMSDGKPFMVSKFYTASLNEKATLRKHLEAWRGVAFTAEELSGFDLKNILGKPCMVVIVKTEKGKIKVDSVSKLSKSMGILTPVNPLINFSLDPTQFDSKVFDALPKGIKEMIVQSPEYRALSDEGPVLGASAEEHIPF